MKNIYHKLLCKLGWHHEEMQKIKLIFAVDYHGEQLRSSVINGFMQKCKHCQRERII